MRIRLVLLCSLLFLFSTCTKDKIDSNEKEEISEGFEFSNHRYIDATDIPIIYESTNKQIEEHKSLIDKRDKGKLPFNINRIIGHNVLELYDEIRDRIGYAFQVEMKYRHPNTFYNVVIYKENDGSLSEAFILQYKMTPTFYKRYKNEEVEFYEYDGTIKRFRLNRIKKENPTKSDPCGCEETTFSGGGGGSGSTGSDSGTSTDGSSGGGGSYSVCTTTTYAVACPCAGHWPGERCTCGTQPYSYSVTSCETIVAFDDCLDPCPDPSGTTPINEPIIDDATPAEMDALILSEYKIDLNSIDLSKSELRKEDIDKLRIDLWNAHWQYADPNQKAEALFDIFWALTTIQELETGIAAANYAKSNNIRPFSTLNKWEIVAHVGWAVLKDEVHLILDAAGMVPILGEPADFVNAVIYLVSGDRTNAAIAFAQMSPIGGQFATIGKYGFKAVKTASNRTAKLVYNTASDGFVKFCNNSKSGGVTNCRSQLSRMFSYNKSTHQAHHMIPWNMREHPLIQKSAKGGYFHMNMKGNGKVIGTDVHNGSHPGYDTVITDYFDELLLDNPNINSEEASEEIYQAIFSISEQLDNGIDINNIVLP